MSGIPRMPRDGDPRRPRTQPGEARQPSDKPPRSYGQFAETPKREQEDIEDFEDLTDEPVREGGDEPSSGSREMSRKKERQLREFEDLAGEPVMDDEDDKSGT